MILLLFVNALLVKLLLNLLSSKVFLLLDSRSHLAVCITKKFVKLLVLFTNSSSFFAFATFKTAWVGAAEIFVIHYDLARPANCANRAFPIKEITVCPMCTIWVGTAIAIFICGTIQIRNTNIHVNVRGTIRVFC